MQYILVTGRVLRTMTSITIT